MMIAREVGRRLSEKGMEVNFQRMEKSTGREIPDDSMVGLAFATAFFSTYPVALDFISRLPEGKGRKIFMLTTAGGTTGGSEGVPADGGGKRVCARWLPDGFNAFQLQQQNSARG